MKKIFTLSVFVCIVLIGRSQAVLNEIYPQPGNGYHEFFELYNEFNAVENLDNYTVIVYFEDNTTTGFYVLDMPNANIPAHGYYVVASQTPFDIQAQLGQTADFSWNSIPAGGSLTRWERNGSSYTSVPVASNLNDFLERVNGGSNGVFHIFVYKNGIIVNGIIGGISTTVVPAYLKAMPPLPVDMSGSSPDFTIDLSTMADNSLEYLTNAVGTNNGYFRSADGFCGEWLKSDSPGQHTPGQTNGTSANLANQVSLAATVTQYAGDPTKALLTYNITAGPAGAFPIIVEVYEDNGVPGQLDLNDVLIDSRTILSSTAGGQDIVLPSWDTQVIIVLRSASDCYNRTLVVANYWSVLPVQLISFQGNVSSSNKISLQWQVSNNKIVDQFEVQRSYDGKDYTTVGVVFASEKGDIENYMFYETINSFDKVMYRLKMTDKNGQLNYSRSLVFQSKLTSTDNNIKILGNPVTDQLTFNYTALSARMIGIKIYDMSGRILMTTGMNSLEGSNMISFPLDSILKPGMHIVEVNDGTGTQKAKFVKQ